MDSLVNFATVDLKAITSIRNGETKFGEKMVALPEKENFISCLKNSEQEFVLFGIPESIGVRANFGRAGTETAWEKTIQALVNVQHNKYCKGSSILVLGALNVTAEMEIAQNLNPNILEDRKKLFDLVSKIDKDVTHIVSKIVEAGKIPIIIGGGHNNAYGNIKGTALAKGKAINAINIDAHTDFRITEGRHSGNGFKYAFEEGFLKNYFIFGLHENYTPKSIFKEIKQLESQIRYNTYEELKIRQEKSLKSEIQNAIDFIKKEPFGIELDLDCIANIASSAITPTGFSVEEIRAMVYQIGQINNASYLHICEGAPSLDHEKNNHLIGKLNAYIITDFIKSKMC